MTVSPARAGASKEISSNTCSMIVARRRAPMSSWRSLTAAAMAAISRRPSPANASATPSVASRAAYWRGSALAGSVRMA